MAHPARPAPDRSLWSGSSETETKLRVQEEKLASHPEDDEVVLWFEHDLFCQTNLIYLLSWLGERRTANTKLSLICIGEFPGLPNFRGLGELNPEQMASLFDKRHEVSQAEKALATAAWQAYCSPDPTAIQAFLQTDTSAMPFLRRALELHLERFPFVSNGLGRIENRTLEFINEGARSFGELFPRFGDAEPTYGLGDAQFWNSLRRMNEARRPVLNIINGNKSHSSLTPETLNQMTFEITDAGAAVLNGAGRLCRNERNGHLVGGSPSAWEV